MTLSDTRILFTDLDDTLLSSDKSVSAENLNSINEMMEAGHKFVVATGRPFYSAYKLSKNLGFVKPGFYIVASNGGVIYDCGTSQMIKRTTVPFEYVSHVFSVAKENGIHVHTYTDEYVVSERETDELKTYCSRISMPYKILNHIPEDLPYEPPKVITIASRSNLSELRSKLSDWCSGKMNTVFSSEFLLEFLPPSATKGNAVKYLCDYFGIPLKNSIACGDEENDISMIDVAGIGAVMKNGTSLCKSHANYITEHTNNENAISEVIHKFIL